MSNVEPPMRPIFYQAHLGNSLDYWRPWDRKEFSQVLMIGIARFEVEQKGGRIRTGSQITYHKFMYDTWLNRMNLLDPINMEWDEILKYKWLLSFQYWIIYWNHWKTTTHNQTIENLFKRERERDEDDNQFVVDCKRLKL